MQAKCEVRRHGTLAGAADGDGKAALEHITRCWALELAPLGVRVNAVAAGPTESVALTGMMGRSREHAAVIEEAEREQITLKQRGVPDDAARWIAHLADPVSDWMTGQPSTEALASRERLADGTSPARSLARLGRAGQFGFGRFALRQRRAASQAR